MNGWFDDDDDEERVSISVGCPVCTEVRMSQLEWYDPGTGPFPRYEHEYVWCLRCGTGYDPNRDCFVIGNSVWGV